jgi:thymidylate synthase (FAD)
MRAAQPEVFLVARPAINWEEVHRYLKTVDGLAWYDRAKAEDRPHGETLIEFMGRMCYRSWAPGLNPNVTRVREDSAAYLMNILRSGHGSVLEHASYSFVFHDVSRVFTHELVRHRAGVAISQESMRYVRLADIPFQHPDYVLEDEHLLAAANELIASMEKFQELTVERTQLEDAKDFHTKKVITSAARRDLPEGVATTIGWTANVRALRHIVTLRTDPAAEAEIRIVFGSVARILVDELPNLFADFECVDGWWRPEHHKV